MNAQISLFSIGRLFKYSRFDVGLPRSIILQKERADIEAERDKSDQSFYGATSNNRNQRNIKLQVETSNKSGGKTPTRPDNSKPNVGGSDEHSHNEKKKPAAY